MPANNNDNATRRPAITPDAIKSCTSTFEACKLVLQAHGPLHRSVLIAKVRSTFPQFAATSEDGIVHRAWSDAKRVKEGHKPTFAFHQRIYSLVSDANDAREKYSEYRSQMISKRK